VGRPLKPQNVTSTIRRALSETGQPGRHVRPLISVRSAPSKRADDHTKVPRGTNVEVDDATTWTEVVDARGPVDGGEAVAQPDSAPDMIAASTRTVSRGAH
jgi:hypothetical protein